MYVFLVLFVHTKYWEKLLSPWGQPSIVLQDGVTCPSTLWSPYLMSWKWKVVCELLEKWVRYSESYDLLTGFAFFPLWNQHCTDSWIPNSWGLCFLVVCGFKSLFFFFKFSCFSSPPPPPICWIFAIFNICHFLLKSQFFYLISSC